MGGIGNISFNGGSSNIPRKDLENVAKYVAGTQIIPMADGPLQGMGGMFALTALIESGKIRRWGQMNEGFSNALKNDRANIRSGFGNNIFKRGLDVETAKAMLHEAEIAEKTQLADIAKFKLDKAKAIKTPTVIDKIKGLWKGGSEAARKERIALLRKEKIDAIEATKATAVAEVAGKTAANEAVGLGTKALKFAKGNSLYLGFESISALFTIIPTFTELGAGKGIKQVAKSTVKVGAAVGGWAAGEYIGMAIGTFLGGPGFGTLAGGAVGSLVGMIGGTIVSWGTRKIADAVVGKDELEIAKEEKAKGDAVKAMKDPQAAQKLMFAASQKLQADDNESEDAKVASRSLNNLSKVVPFQANASEQYAQNSPNMNNGLSSNPFANGDLMDKDLMAMSAGLA